MNPLKHQLTAIAAALALSASQGRAGVVIEGGVQSATDASGTPLAGGKAAMILVDIDGDGISRSLGSFSVSVGDLLDGDYVAAIGRSTAVFGTSSITVQSQVIDLAVTPVDTGQPYYIIWVPSIDADSSTTTITTTGDAPYLFVRGDSWVVPGEGGSATPPAATAPFVIGGMDSDGDGVSDFEDDFPNDPDETIDTDGDGTGNNADTDDDNDGFLDAVDDFPLDPSEWLDTDGDGTGNNADPDDDGDGLDDVTEGILGSDPLLVDSDSDGLDDPYEFAFGLLPLNPDSDGDGILDGAEDEDMDTLTNAEEAALGTSPYSDDTDFDDLKDQDEVNLYLTAPNDADTDDDLLEDGVEINVTMTDPREPDSDFNGVPDGDEDPDSDLFTNIEEVIIHLTDPRDAESRFRTHFMWSPLEHSIGFVALSGRRYRVERTVDLRDPEAWSEVITFVGTGAPVTVPLGVPFSALWFYRVGVSLH